MANGATAATAAVDQLGSAAVMASQVPVFPQVAGVGVAGRPVAGVGPAGFAPDARTLAMYTAMQNSAAVQALQGGIFPGVPQSAGGPPAQVVSTIYETIFLLLFNFSNRVFTMDIRS